MPAAFARLYYRINGWTRKQTEKTITDTENPEADFRTALQQIISSLDENPTAVEFPQTTKRISTTPDVSASFVQFTKTPLTEQSGARPNSGRKSAFFLQRNLKRSQTLNKLGNRRKRSQAKKKREEKRSSK